MARLTRRRFLKLAATTSVAMAASCAPAPKTPTASPGETATTVADSANHLSEASTTQLPKQSLDRLEPAPTDILITSAADLYEQSYFKIPEVNPDEWSLVIEGLVDRPLKLTFDEIRALPSVEIMRTLTCISNPVGGNLIGNAVWTGTYLQPLLKEVGAKPSAIYAKFEAADGYHTSIDLKFLDEPRSFLAYAMNGEPLTKEHGWPLRLFFPGSYGQKMPKWITRIELIDYEYEGYWESKGWSNIAQAKTNSIIKQPRRVTTLGMAPVPIWGVAYAGKRDIAKVEIKIGDEDWRETTLLHGPSNEVWTQWSLTWTPPAPGTYPIQVRAADSTGVTQRDSASGLLDGAFPDGANTIHRIVVTIQKG
jgi:DMSO/TMAO reductase YedYZ molybdopterin-dependent catalytic subunit